jgi:hypothetical protein
MKSLLPIIAFLITLTSCQSQTIDPPKTKTSTVEVIEKTIPFSFGLHNDYDDKAHFTITNAAGQICFSHTGQWKHWGSVPQKPFQKTGTYTLTIKFPEDTVKRDDIEQLIVLDNELEKIDISVASVNGFGGSYNGITVNKYYGNKLNLKLSSNWNPQHQFETDSLLIPDLIVTNTNDSTVFGIHHRFSSSMSVSWVQKHYITFLRFEHLVGSKWTPIKCNAPRVQMDLKKGEQGETLKDMVLGCVKKNFKRGEKYRVVLEYGINDGTTKRVEATATSAQYIYLENYIYQIMNEFELK